MDYNVKKNMILQHIDKLMVVMTPYNAYMVCYELWEMPEREVLTTMDKEAWTCFRK